MDEHIQATLSEWLRVLDVDAQTLEPEESDVRVTEGVAVTITHLQLQVTTPPFGYETHWEQ